METIEIVSIRDFTKGGVMVQARIKTLHDLKNNTRRMFLTYL